MIDSVDVADFLAHARSEVRLERDGVTVFVGNNGAGKSSMVDAITFALFGKHTRKSNSGLIRRGSNQGFARVRFSVEGRQYEAVRKIDARGKLTAKLSRVEEGGGTRPIAEGERRQFDESMTREVERIIGLDFEKLSIASIVRQGELNSIIEARPKEFKELLNAVIGIDRLNAAAESMKAAIAGFRDGIRGETGHDDRDIGSLSRQLEAHLEGVAEAEPRRERLEREQGRLQGELSGLRDAVARDELKADKIRQLRRRREALLEYARGAVDAMRREIAGGERKLRDCEGCLEAAGGRAGLEEEIAGIRRAQEDARARARELEGQSASLAERLDLAAKLRLKDNRCPVCNSRVERLNPLFREEHLREERERVRAEIASWDERAGAHGRKRAELSDMLQAAGRAEATLGAHSIASREQLEQVRADVEAKRKRVGTIPAIAWENARAISRIDAHAGRIFAEIRTLEDESVGFDEAEFATNKGKADRAQAELARTNRDLGAVSEKIAAGRGQAASLRATIARLRTAGGYAQRLERIQRSVFDRDGPVTTSLRSWALNEISAKSSEYLQDLNTKIQRVSLSEGARDVTITCHSKTETLDLQSLSGGEKVSVALALRLGMASLLGASHLGLMILDEPTAHLDADRKKALVEVLSHLSGDSGQNMPRQFLIITHDEEIFENALVGQVFRFSPSERGDGTEIVAL